MGLPKINARLLKPYVSFVVFVQPSEGASADIVCREIHRCIEEDDRSELLAVDLSQSPRDDDTSTEVILALAFATHRPPPWGGLTSKAKSEHTDRMNHLVLVVKSGDLIAVHSTESRIKEHLLRKQAKLELGGVGLLDRAALEEALLAGEIATFWMGQGSKRKGNRGPRSKTTYGDRLEDTIDVIGDQRHTLSGARARAGEDLLGQGRGGVVGANLDHSSAWFIRADNLGEFVQIVGRMLMALRNVLSAGGGRERFVIFARYVDDLDAVDQPYDISFTSPTEVAGELATAEQVDAYDWFQSHLVRVAPAGRRTASLTVTDDSGQLATVAVRPELGARGRISFRVARSDGEAALTQDVAAMFEQLEPAIFYESGHTVSSSGVVAEHFSDVPYGGWLFDPLDGVDISIEKPGDCSRAAIRDFGGTELDQSLFGWVIRNRNAGWLYCDDGSDELCDFVFFDDDVGDLEIWHVKACKAGDGRGIASVPYEQVCAQAVKNMPPLSVERLSDELDLRQQSDSAGPLWHHGTLSDDLPRMIAALRRPRPNLRVVVNVFQPHVTEGLLQRARSRAVGGVHGEEQRLRRLDHLLVATDDSVSRLGAHLQVLTLGISDP